MNIFKPLAVAAMSIAVTMATSSANAEGCLAYNKPVTLTGTVLIRKIEYDKRDYPTPPHTVSIPFLVADQAICMRPSEDEEAESKEWAVQLADNCARGWPTVSRVKITGTLYHAHTRHHHSKVLILAKQIVRLDGRLPPCSRE
jgi:Domain of unknown function (DUF4431)